MATINIEPIHSDGTSAREQHAAAYSQVIADVLDDVVRNCGDPRRIRSIFTWAFSQLKLSEDQIIEYVEDVRLFKNYFSVIKQHHVPFDWQKRRGEPNRDLLIAEACVLLDGKANIEQVVCNMSVAWPDAYKHCRELLMLLFNYEAFGDGKRVERDAETGTFSWGGKLKGCSEKWGAYEFLRRLKVRYCPYCNAETVYAIEVRKSGKDVPIRSALDHFIPHAEYPFLGLSLYNLVPSCYRCNSQIKERRTVNLATSANPYIHDIYSGYRFRVRATDIQKLENDEVHPQFDLEIKKEKGSSVGDKTVALMKDFFDLEGVYNSLFKDEAYDIIRRIRLFTPAYREMMRKSGLRRVSVSRALFGCDLHQAHITDFRHAKLVIDLKRQFSPKT